MPKSPLDRLPKLARTTHCFIVTDTDAADAFDVALAASLAKSQELSASSMRRAAAVRASLPASISAEEATAALGRLLDADTVELEPTRTALEAASAALDAARQEWTFRSLGRAAWKALVAKHPATEQDNAEWLEQGGTGKSPYSFETMSRELVQTSAVPALTQEAVDDMFDGALWNDAELTTLFQHALLAQTQARPDPKARR